MGGVVSDVLGLGSGSSGGGGEAAQPLRDFSPTNINTGGFSFSGKDLISGGSTAERLGFIRQLSDLYKGQAGQVAALKPQVGLGFTQLRQALSPAGVDVALNNVLRQRLQQIEDARTRTTGDLRENLSRRRVLGSSFGQDVLSRAESEYGRLSEQAVAETELLREQQKREAAIQEASTKLQEIDANRQILSEEFSLNRESVNTFINNLNVEAQIATQLASNATSALSANAQMQSKILQQEADMTRKSTEGILGEIFGGFGTFASGGFGGGLLFG